jgi:isopropylmalate/homocitrate/citramalate synthase
MSAAGSRFVAITEVDTPDGGQAEKEQISVAAAKADVMVGFISASESHRKTNLNKTIYEAIADFAQVVPIANQWGIQMHGGLATAFR